MDPTLAITPRPGPEGGVNSQAPTDASQLPGTASPACTASGDINVAKQTMHHGDFMITPLRALLGRKDWPHTTACVKSVRDAYETFRLEAGGELPNKRMQLTKLRAAPVLQAEVPPCAPAGQSGGGTASQLIRSVRRTRR